MTHVRALQGRRILVVVPPSRFAEAPFFQAWQLLADEGAWLTLASDSRTGVAVGEDGGVATVSLPLAAANVRDFDGVVVVGGIDAAQSLRAMRGFESMATAAELGVPLAAIAGAEEAVDGAIEGTGRDLPRWIAEFVVRVSKRPAVGPSALHP